MSREVPLYMPKMSMTMETGELLSWSKSEGDELKSGEVVAEVATDKIDMEVESPVDGVLARIVAQPGETLQVGSPIAFITTEAEDLMAGLFDPVSEPDTSEPAVPEPAQAASQPGAVNGRAATDGAANGRPVNGGAVNGATRRLATPVSRRGPQPAVPFARRRAAQLRVALEDVVPTGANGVITVADVESAGQAANSANSAKTATAPGASGADTQNAVAAAGSVSAPAAPPAPRAPVADAPVPAPVAPASPAQAAAPAPDPGFADDLAPRRRAIRAAVARTMSASAAVPQFTVFAELNLEAVNQVRNGVGWTTLFLRGLSRVLRQYPQVNAGWGAAANAPAAAKDGVGVALAIDSAVGLLAPVIRDADLLPVGELDALVRATVDRARIGKLTAADLQGGTTTLSNLGGFGVPSFTSLLTPPQATAVSVGSISQRPVVVGGGLAVRLGTTVGLTVDHRPVDGADAARILADLQELFSRPDTLFGG